MMVCLLVGGVFTFSCARETIDYDDNYNGEFADEISYDSAAREAVVENSFELEEEITKMVNIEGVYHDPWHYKDVLTAKEKKDFGLNTRKKISREFLEFISEKGLTMSEPENLLWRIYSKYDKIIYEKYDTIETKQIGNKTIIGSSTLLEHFNE